MTHVHGLPRFGSRRNSSNKRDDDEDDEPSWSLPPSLTQQTPIYRTPFYVEEASLYSIAEDSREDRASEVTSRAGTISTTSTPVSVKHEALSLPSSPANGPVLTDWSIDMDDENWGLHDDDVDEDGFDNNLVNAAKRSQWAPPTVSHHYDGGEESSSPSDDGTYPMSLDQHDHPDTGKRRTRNLLIYSALIAIVFASVVISISIALLNKSSDPAPRTVASDGLAVSAGVPPTLEPSSPPSTAPTDVPTGSPSSEPTAEPTSAPFPEQVDTEEEQQVYNAISSCESANLEDALDPGTIAYQVYRQLVFEAGGTQMGQEQLLERYALVMLFLMANGEAWDDSAKWFLVGTDVCDWSEGRIICEPRVDGGAAVTGLFLRNNNMYGQIPKALCCLPKLEKLDLSDNHLSAFPPCLSEMNLGILNLSGNP